MPTADKIVARMRSNPRDWRIEDLKVVASSLGIDYDQGRTSHVVFRHPKGGRLSVPARRPIKPVYIRLFLELIDRLGNPQ
jgi:hypothetical protein